MPSSFLDQLLPRVVHHSYFDAPGIADVNREPHRFGIIRPLGNDLIAFLAYVDDKMIRNVHLETLQDHGLTVNEAWKTATENLRRLAFDSKTIKQTITKATDGRDWSVWYGNEFTSSTILLPDLFMWSRKNLNCDSLLVRLASTQTVFILQKSHANDLPAFDKYIAKVLEGSTNWVSDKWFVVDATGTTPFVAADE